MSLGRRGLRPTQNEMRVMQKNPYLSGRMGNSDAVLQIIADYFATLMEN